ncbi:ATP-binding protein [Saccharothrix obliqua]|uniref:ATP-binding protein n=1 Tax=Saccharothrix obliqua TaxID=2861747 RepID=UPI001C5F390E|nr:ATP-binding protein [Saccharothrix obliqua]MBW4717519.1 ATP-binding protein [Saccharothrix obliqua]
MSGNRVCWDRSAIEFATQIDVGGLEIGDRRADAVFAAIHQELPLEQVRDAGGERISEVTQDGLLKAFTKPIDSNEPRLVFITGLKGTGKSHLVRWLKSRIGARPDWHVVYIEKRNTNLRRVIEHILDGIDTSRAEDLRKALVKAGSEIATDAEAMNALLGRLDHLVTFDQAGELPGLTDFSPAELAELRTTAHRLLGDFTFRAELSKEGGPIHRIVRLAMGNADDAGAQDSDLHITEQDLSVDPFRFEDAGQQVQQLVRSVIASKELRADLAALCDAYLERAKGDVFTGPNVSLLEVFEDVRREIANRGQELCLFIEDLVLLHGIDKQLAQALTIPANSQLCKLRAAIAVTNGYLASVDTFADRGDHYRINIDLAAIGSRQLRDFVGRYLNAGRLTDEELLLDNESSTRKQSNACLRCPDRAPCHQVFGASKSGHGFYPFNGQALDRMVELASPGAFQPRQILRHVIREPLEVAEEELPQGGVFPSADFARSLDGVRASVPVEVRGGIHRTNRASPHAELTLRAFYASQPPAIDDSVLRIAKYLGVTLGTSTVDPEGPPSGEDEKPTPDGGVSEDPSPRPSPGPKLDEFDRWTVGEYITSDTAHRIRNWICETTVAYLLDGPYGLAIGRTGKFSWRIGSYEMRTTDVHIQNASGSNTLTPRNPFPITVTDENALMLRGVHKAALGGRLDDDAGGTWFFSLQARISRYADKIAHLARQLEDDQLETAVRALTVLRRASDNPGNSVRDALPEMLKPHAPANGIVRAFLADSRGVREESLRTLRNHATASKGLGAPSVIDIALVYQAINQHLKERTFAGQPPTGGGEALTRLQSRLDRAATKAWAEIDELLTSFASLLDPEENLTATRKTIKLLLERSVAAGRLPHRHLKVEYENAEAKVEAAHMNLYRQMVRISPAKDLWEVKGDPAPALRALRNYAVAADRLLAGLEDSLGHVGVDDVELDVDGLTEQLRALAEDLDTASGKWRS